MTETVLSYPILSVVTFLPLVGVLIILLLKNNELIKYTALITTVVDLIVSIPIFTNFD